MTVKELIDINAEEKPLDNVTDGSGYAGIFRSFCIIGDSLASGEFEGKRADGTTAYHDMYDYSWGAYLGRACGATVHNFSRGGMTAREFMTSWAEYNGFFDAKYAAQGYILALGMNDLFGCDADRPMGTIADVHPDMPETNAKSFAGYFGAIISKYKSIQKNAKFFLLTMPSEQGAPEREQKKDVHRQLMYDMATVFDNTYVIDLREFAPCYDENFKKKFYKHGHMNPMGYLFTGRLVTSYIDYIIRHNPENFISLGTVGTDFEDEG